MNTYVRNELVKLGLAHEVFQVEEEIEALLVRDAGKRIIRILALEVSDQFGKFMILAKVVHRVLEGLPADNGREVAVGFTVAVDGNHHAG